jgi:hypothetical protein
VTFASTPPLAHRPARLTFKQRHNTTKLYETFNNDPKIIEASSMLTHLHRIGFARPVPNIEVWITRGTRGIVVTATDFAAIGS